MQQLADYGFVIKRTNFSEADRYISIFTRNNGKQELVAKGVRRIASRRSPHLELLNQIKFNAVKTRKNFILTDVEVVKTSSLAKEKEEHIGAIFLICELIDKLCPVEQKHEDVFMLIKSTLLRLEKEENVQVVIYDFEKQLLILLGFWDPEKKFSSSQELENYIEMVTERKLKSRSYLKL